MQNGTYRIPIQKTEKPQENETIVKMKILREIIMGTNILQHLISSTPINSKVNIFKSKRNFRSDFANINLFYKNNFSALIKLNWASPIKTRVIKIYFEKGIVIYDENEDIYKISIYQKDPTVGFIHDA